MTKTALRLPLLLLGVFPLTVLAQNTSTGSVKDGGAYPAEENDAQHPCITGGICRPRTALRRQRRRLGLPGRERPKSQLITALGWPLAPCQRADRLQLLQHQRLPRPQYRRRRSDGLQLRRPDV
ncbi:MAG: hypothetical protein IPM81_20280 [Saprospirales bacterium]|nr:hypothetical protein [Saprospirales bacterium]